MKFSFNGRSDNNRSSFSHSCYKRSLSSPSGASPARGNPSSSHPRNSFSGSLLICQYYYRHGHNAKPCYKLHGCPSNHSRGQANTVNKDSGSESSWLLDFSTSHHVTRDLANLTLACDYTGNDKLVDISQNLFFVSQLCQSNFAAIEFFP